jgi:transcriptional regulator with XRE-family HTH domain
MLKLVTLKIEHIDHRRTGALARQERLAVGMTLKQVGDLMVLTESYLSDLERGNRNWDTAKVEQFNNALKGVRT